MPYLECSSHYITDVACLNSFGYITFQSSFTNWFQSSHQLYACASVVLRRTRPNRCSRTSIQRVTSWAETPDPPALELLRTPARNASGEVARTTPSRYMRTTVDATVWRLCSTPAVNLLDLRPYGVMQRVRLRTRRLNGFNQPTGPHERLRRIRFARLAQPHQRLAWIHPASLVSRRKPNAVLMLQYSLTWIRTVPPVSRHKRTTVLMFHAPVNHVSRHKRTTVLMLHAPLISQRN